MNIYAQTFTFKLPGEKSQVKLMFKYGGINKYIYKSSLHFYYVQLFLWYRERVWCCVHPSPYPNKAIGEKQPTYQQHIHKSMCDSRDQTKAQTFVRRTIRVPGSRLSQLICRARASALL